MTKVDIVSPMLRHRAGVLLSRSRSGVGQRGRPLAHGLVARAIHVHLVIDGRDPAHGDEVVFTAGVFGQLDRVLSLDVIDRRDLVALRASTA